jgi:hypothetical protein
MGHNQHKCYTAYQGSAPHNYALINLPQINVRVFFFWDSNLAKGLPTFATIALFKAAHH